MITWNLLRCTSFFDCVWIGPAAFVAGPVTIFEKKVISLRYRTCNGEDTTAQIDGRMRYQFVPNINNVTLPLRIKYSSSHISERTGVADLRAYVINALTSGSCIIVRRNSKSILVVCNKLE